MICFYNFVIEKNKFTCKVRTNQKEDELSFDLLAENVVMSQDDIACALATLCGNKYKSVKIDLDITEACYNQIQGFLECDLSVKRIVKKEKRRLSVFHNKDFKKKYMLSFSGGFDSLAALALLPPDETTLVSIDFGGWFDRERLFFEKFHTNIVKTNFRQLGYADAHYTFMGVSALLFQNTLKSQYHIFGTILEASVNHFLKEPNSLTTLVTPPISITGLKDIWLTNGLTEVGTALW